MEIRRADENDIPEIVEVLKASLGQDQLQLSEKVWRYKHIDNPFGHSIIFIALEDEKIIGVRAFMRWEWHYNGKKYKALRAVDTATHPNHQGKGVFKKLTLKAVNFAQSINDHFVFNTPNEQSRPGYLKMGWEQVGKIYVGLKPSLSFLKFKKTPQVYNVQKNISRTELEKLCANWNQMLQDKKGFFTPKCSEMLRWRYEENPLQSYEVIAAKEYYLAGYIKKRGRLKEFRIAEFIYDENLLTQKKLKKIIDKAGSKFSCHVISFSPNFLELNSKKGFFGPILTFKTLNVDIEEKDRILKITNWNNSLGDLELF